MHDIYIFHMPIVAPKSSRGKKGQGVFLYQLAEMIVRTLLVAVLKAAPENLRENLFRRSAPSKQAYIYIYDRL